MEAVAVLHSGVFAIRGAFGESAFEFGSGVCVIAGERGQIDKAILLEEQCNRAQRKSAAALL